jgi:hypothetical protein
LVSQETCGGGGVHRWLPWSGVAAVIGTILVIGTPWVQTAVLGTRPYATSVFDVSSFAGWLLMAASLVGVYVIFDDQFARLGRVSVMTTAVGMALMSVLLLRRVILFVDAGFHAIPATGEDPAGLLLSITTVLDLALTVIGAGGIGLALRRSEISPTITSQLLLLAPILPGILIVFDQLVGLPLPVGRLLVRTNVILVPFGLGWLALGLRVWVYARSTSSSTAVVGNIR